MTDRHVVSLELSKKLWGAGIVIKEPLFWWNSDIDDEYSISDKKEWLFETTPSYPAPLASELAEMMVGKGMGTMACATLAGREWWCTCGTWDAGAQKFEGLERAETMPDMLAKVALYLKDKGLLGEKSI